LTHAHTPSDLGHPQRKRDRCQERVPVDATARGLILPTFTRARRVDALRSLWLADTITSEAWQAACWFRDDAELASGGRKTDPYSPSGGSGATEMPVAVLDACTRLRMAWRAIGKKRSSVAVTVVLGGQSLASADAGHRHGTARVILDGVLNALVRVYAKAAPATGD
jgi:hypothetical protein